MRDRPRATISDLRQAIDCLPRATKVAMLDGIARHPIIVGAYSGDDGICPMLAAHREGGRTSFIGFAKAWDRFAFRDSRRCRARRASERELLVLRTHLEASLLAESTSGSGDSDLAAAMAEHAELAAARARPGVRERERAARRSRREHAPVRPGDADRSRELRGRDGWAWMRVVRRLDDYERVLERLETERELTTPDGGRAGRELIPS